MNITRTIKKTDVNVIYYSKYFRCESTLNLTLYGELSEKQIEKECMKATPENGVYLEYGVTSVESNLYSMPLETFISNSTIIESKGE